MVEEVSEICHGCNPSLLLDSTSFMKTIQSNVNTCDFHYQFIKTIKQSYLIFNQQRQQQQTTLTTQQQQQHQPVSKLNFNQQQPRQPEKHLHRQHQLPKPVLPVQVSRTRIPIRSLLRKEKDWESMSVFSYRSEVSVKSHATEKTSYTEYLPSSPMSRRRRKEYSQAEVNYIIDGAQRYGRRWKFILNAYPFQSGRTAIDLKDKYKKLKFTDSTLPIPFTAQELVNLKRGVTQYGPQWDHILESYGFEETRTSTDLHEKWDMIMEKV